jgi:cell division protein FtsQ
MKTLPRRKARHARSRVWPVLAAGAFAGVVATGTFVVLRTAAWLESDGVLPVRSIAVTGAEGERAREVTAYADVRHGEPLLGVDLDEVVRRVEQHPFVKSAQVRRIPPDGLEIVVSQRRAVALLAVAGGLYLVDEEARAFKRARPGDGLDLPVITGLAAAALEDEALGALAPALALLRAHTEGGSPGGALAEVHMETSRRPVAVLAGGLRLVFGEDGFEEKWERARRALEALERRQEAAKSIYLDDGRRPERVAVRLRARPEMDEKPGG